MRHKSCIQFESKQKGGVMFGCFQARTPEHIWMAYDFR